MGIVVLKQTLFSHVDAVEIEISRELFSFSLVPQLGQCSRHALVQCMLWFG